MRFEIEDLEDGYTEICQAVMREGDIVSPRGQRTAEVLDAVIVVDKPQLTLPVGVNRHLNPQVGVAEALQLVSGLSYPRLMTTISAFFDQVTDGGVLHGAYGPRVRPQIERVVQRLKDDHDTRQAVATIWDPLYDGTARVPRDLPCTVSLQWTIRNDALNMHVHMRSNDVWLGLAYDPFQFTRLQMAIANQLGVVVGKYYHHATSLHAYERDWDGIEQLAAYSTYEKERHWAYAPSFKEAEEILRGHVVRPALSWYANSLPRREEWT